MAMGKMYLAARRSRKVVKRRKPRRPKMGSIPRLLSGGYPVDAAKATFVYSGRGSIDLSASADAAFSINCNGLYDPEKDFDLTITSERNAQPRYFDQILGVLYDSYRVVGSKLEVEFQNTSADETGLCTTWCYVVPDSDAGDTVITSSALVREHPFINRKGGMYKELGLIRGAGGVAKLTSTWNESQLD